jgi:hypothetical protein
MLETQCGMVYMEPEQMGWKVLVQSWISRFDGNAMAQALSVPEAAAIDPVKFGKNSEVDEVGVMSTCVKLSRKRNASWLWRR